MCTQAATLLHVSNLFGTEPQREVAATLDRLIDAGPGRVFFCNSGAEANECALKLARRWGGRGRHVVVSAYGSFHGRTLATLHATGQPAKHEPFQPLPEGFRHVAWRDVDALAAALDPSVAACCSSRCRARVASTRAGREYFEAVRRALRRAGRPADRRRGPDRSGPHGRMVRLPALRHPSRRRHRGQGPRQRRADRGLLGARRRGRRLRAGRPRHHVRRPAPGDRGGPGRAGGHGGRGRPGPGRGPPAPTSMSALQQPARRGGGAGPGLAGGGRARRGQRRRPGRRRRPRRPVWSSTR